MDVSIVVLAAGQGSRMKSALPKVLHTLAGKPLAAHVVDTARHFSDDINLVVGHGAEQVKAYFADASIKFCLQAEQLGTGHAVAQALPNLPADGAVLILYGDVPLTQPDTLKALVAKVGESSMGLLTVITEDPTGYGRIVRNEQGEVQAIVEQKDASEAELAITEVNSGIMAVPAQALHQWLPKLKNNNAQGEYYLTDLIAMAVANDVKVNTVHPMQEHETLGVNNRLQLAQLERWHQQQIANGLMTDGVTLRDPARLDVRGNLTAGQDCIIDINCVFNGNVQLGDNVTIGANCIISDASIGAGSVIEANSVIENASLGEQVTVGPFARLRPGAELADNSKIGNFVEIKKAFIGKGSKVNHLSYVGDATVGEKVNIGAGAITCNYDGANKHHTHIEDGAFIGSDSQLVAPVTVGKNATVGAGATITRDVPEGVLAVTRVKQTSIENWQRPTKKDT
ncbi:bifunctional UDP-N-acetylglucosamine diphosphorylase/glucosamine-1-phosphate N-acetyltransferase GlmU [Reinekea thalattae]|uniref:Bifunctional protein GlmU n=1 Tax=Reinekea thalattae TaxID=2593301 RepID=A0A5C8ZBK5_9GAMM|nr:bifunctional UDP-N-acetylglucosamine diphosphorylase/glucosamine-1-phosphate N-acetyltransferase GlmU [Reinekea thalattae]TXR54543.1 UDP-N-acetylglucosamine diphosphorylase/glucosamine-1-phosphate N-acetyltransferase [Reinekea thalattae]